jgi:hypothetical protein
MASRLGFFGQSGWAQMNWESIGSSSVRNVSNACVLAGKLPPSRAAAGRYFPNDGVGRFDFRRETRLGGQWDQRHDPFLLRSRECVPIRKSKSRLDLRRHPV